MRITKDFHIHNCISKDGTGSFDDIAAAAKSAGLTKFAITNHSFNHKYGRWENDYEFVRAECKRVGAVFGIEADIYRKDGRLGGVRGREFELVVAGFHRSPNWGRAFFGTKKGNTQMYINTIQKNKIDILAHLNTYIKVDCKAVAEVAASRGVLIEINGKRVDFTHQEFLDMQSTGVKFIINSDAHCPSGVGKPTAAYEFLKGVKFNPKQIVNLAK
ncbi:MAG: PHP domain-containing protein [Firmicutes bacterium]|nr:PHP domain-containing protein [Bacillota bacterium]